MEIKLERHVKGLAAHLLQFGQQCGVKLCGDRSLGMVEGFKEQKPHAYIAQVDFCINRIKENGHPRLTIGCNLTLKFSK